MNELKATPGQAESDRKLYARSMIRGDVSSSIEIEKRWGLFGYTPEIVSTVLACVATGLPLDAAIDEATGGAL